MKFDCANKYVWILNISGIRLFAKKCGFYSVSFYTTFESNISGMQNFLFNTFRNLCVHIFCLRSGWISVWCVSRCKLRIVLKCFLTEVSSYHLIVKSFSLNEVNVTFGTLGNLIKNCIWNTHSESGYKTKKIS